MAAAEQTISVDVPGSGAVTVVRTKPRGDAGWTFIYAPGASANVNDPFGVHAAGVLAERGVSTVRMQFPYQQAKKSAPDRPPVLEATWRAVIDAVRADGAKLCIGGRSMGGRIGSMVHAATGPVDGVKVDALALFAYPLHPPGKPQQLRTEHLPSIKARTLCVSGTRDAFASVDELRAAAALVKRSNVHVLEGADHGFNVPKSSGRAKVDVWDEAVGALVGWLKV
jgi:predicted alpha/beta-hydrolase family hydrolase